MGRFTVPITGNLNQDINPWTWVFSPSSGGQVGFFNFRIDLGPSTDPTVEQDILSGVASYGKQIGRIEDALTVLIDRLEATPGITLTKDEDQAITAFKALMYEINAIKKKRVRD
ncbi:hypothetical protein [Rhizobium sp. SG2393]|uniref:hypothetical protein n=1 Tax=Rhizobium sp. SG2393 TaxID=3276279 RepID=UPI00366DD70E